MWGAFAAWDLTNVCGNKTRSHEEAHSSTCPNTRRSDCRISARIKTVFITRCRKNELARAQFPLLVNQKDTHRNASKSTGLYIYICVCVLF